MIGRFFKARRRGAMAMVAVAAMVPTTAMMSANINTSQMVNDRRLVQDGADALAEMHGAWTARALNVISMNNVTTAQLLTVAVGSEALIATSAELLAASAAATAYIAGHNAAHCTPRQPNNPLMWFPEGIWFGYCQFYHGVVTVPAANAAAQAGSILSYFKPGHGVDTATKALEAIDGMNNALLARHPIAMAEIGADYAHVLGLTDLHFADPCNGAGLRNCSSSNTRNGMALPLEEEATLADALTGTINIDNKYAELYLLMSSGTTVVNTTFAARGFPQGKGPVTNGGGAKPHVRDHINQVTGIGDALNNFQSFYTNKYSDLPRYPYTVNPPNNTSPYNGQERQVGDGIIGRSGGGIFNFLEEIAGFANTVSEIVLKAVRLIPLSYDRHPRYARLLIDKQDTDGPENAFHRLFNATHLTVATPDIRNNSFGLMAPVPTMYRLKDMTTPEALAAAAPTQMTDPFRILAFGLRDLSPRLSGTVLTSQVERHTGYGQVGVFNPDGASLYSQNWHHRLMPATRMDDAAFAGQNLAQQAPQGFADLARALTAVNNAGTWDRVHAH